MFGYRCDKCDTPINIDPGEERVCDACLARMQRREKSMKITYQPRKREVQYAG